MGNVFQTPSSTAQAAVAPTVKHAFEVMLELVPGAWFFTRQDGTFAYVNPGACRSLGYTRQELLGLTVFDIDPLIDQAIWRNRWNSLGPNETKVFETHHRRRDKTSFPIEIRALRVELEGESFSVSYSIDLTATEKTKQTLRATESRLQELLGHLPDLVFRLRLLPEPNFDYVSPASEGILGYRPEQLTSAGGLGITVVEPADLPSLLNLHEAQPGQSRKLRFVHASGSRVWMDLRATRVDTERGQPIFLEGIARDVTKSHNADLANRKLRAAIEQAAESVVVTDNQGRVEYVNPAYQQTSGIPARHAVGQLWNALEIEEDLNFLENLGLSLVEGSRWQGRLTARRADGQTYVEQATLSPILDEDGRRIGCVAVKRDITEQLKLEDQLQQSQKLEAVGRLAGGIAHDFNNLLHVIQGHTHLMQALEPQQLGNGEELFEMLSEVDHASTRAATLVRQLLVFSRDAEPQWCELQLDEILEGLHGVLQGVLGPHIQLVVRCNVRGATIVGDAVQLEQVITHLCANAGEASSPGDFLRIQLDSLPMASLPHAFLQRGGRPPTSDHYLLLSVQDDGKGMTGEVQRRMFEPFFSTKPAGRGSGLGLATTYAVVQAHHGFIDSTSTPRQGSTFRVFLPRVDESAASYAPPPSLPPRSRVNGNERLALVAEDEPAVLALTASYLTQAGFRVVTATSGPAAEHLLGEHGSDIEVAVLDAVMPGFGAEGVQKSMMERNLTAPVLIVTGYHEASFPEAQRRRSTALLRKPFGPNELLSALERLLVGQ